ncbi:MAG: glycosyltransferase family 2 protein [Halobacteriaceae archaeon]
MSNQNTKSSGGGDAANESGLFQKETSEIQTTDRPAVGIFVSHRVDPNEVAGAILRAKRNGFPTIVVHENDSESEAVQFARQLETIVVDLSPRQVSSSSPEKAVRSISKSNGFPGVFWQPDPSERIDFATSIEQFEADDSYLIEPKLKPDVETDLEVLVGIPAYEEETTIADVVSEAKCYADEVLVVDDGSNDATSTEAKNAGATVVSHEKNQGYGAALKTVFNEAHRSGVDHLVILDGDGQHNPSDIDRLVSDQRDQESEIVIGSRFVEDADTNAPLYRRFGLFIVNLLTNLSFGVIRPKSWINDTQSGFRAYDQRAVESLAMNEHIGDQMSASTDILHHAYQQGFDIEEVGTSIDYDIKGTSSQNPVSHGIILVMNILRTVEQDRPVTILGIPGFASVLIGIGLGYWTFANYITSGSFPLGIALTSAFFALAGIFASFTAIILHSLNTHTNH